jgi:hypothetical protein
MAYTVTRNDIGNNYLSNNTRNIESYDNVPARVHATPNTSFLYSGGSPDMGRQWRQ